LRILEIQMKEYTDWSARHARLRAEMVAVGFAIFLCARLGVSVSGGSFLGLDFPQWFTRDVLAFWLSLLFLYLFVHFSVRTRAEMPRVSSHAARLNRAIERISKIAKRTSELVSRFSGALLARRLAIWDEAVREVSVVPNASDMALLRDLGNKLDSLQVMTERIEAPMEQNKKEDVSSPYAVIEGNVFQLEARQLIETLAKLDEVGHALNRRTVALEKALTETRQVLSDAQSFFSNEKGQGAEDLNGKLAAAVGELRAVLLEFKSSRRAFSLERNVFSVAIPKYLSLLMVGLSADAILKGAEVASAHVALFVQSRLDLLSGLA
jgi:hypothetical protein